MSATDAAVALNEKLSKWKWFRMVGVGADQDGKEELVVYVRSFGKSTQETVPDSWKGFNVRIAGMSDPKVLDKKKSVN